MTVHSGSGYAGQEHVNDGFHVRYLGSVHFPNQTKKVNIKSLQRPLLDLYTKARRRGEDHRGVHSLALTQHLHLSDYGLVVAENEENVKTRCQEAVVIKVITPVAGLILWTAVRFHTRILKRRKPGAAFVPLACSDTVFEKDCYVQLTEKRRFLMGLTHPPLFACLFRRVGSPQFVECHAFVCFNIEDAMIICSSLDSIKNTCEGTGPLGLLLEDGSTNPTLDTSRKCSNKLNVVVPELSFISHSREDNDKKADHMNNRTNTTAFKRYRENKARGIPDSNIKYGPQGGRVVSIARHHGRREYEEEYNRSKSCERLENINAFKAQNKRSKSCGRLVDGHFPSVYRRKEPFSNSVYRNSSTSLSDQERSCDDTNVVKRGNHFTRSKSVSKICQINDSSSSENTRNIPKTNIRDRNITKMKRFHSCNKLENGFSSSPNSSEIHYFKPETQVNTGHFNINSSTSRYSNNDIPVYYNNHGLPEHARKEVGSKQDAEDISMQIKAKKTANLDVSLLPEEERKYIWQTIQQRTAFHRRNLKNSSPEKYSNKLSYPSQEGTVQEISMKTVDSKKNSVTPAQKTNVENEVDSQYSTDTTVEGYRLDHRHRSYGDRKTGMDSRLERFTSSDGSDYYSHLSDERECPKERSCKINGIQIPINKTRDNSDSQNMYDPRASMQDERFDESQIRIPCKEEMELSKTMSFSSESEYSYSSAESNNKEQVNEVLINGRLITGHGEYHVNPQWEHGKEDSELQNRHSEQHLYVRQSAVEKTKHKTPGNKNWPNLNSGENRKLTIKVPYQRNSLIERNDLMPNGKTYFLPHGVRSYNKFNKVKNWSTLSEVSNSTNQDTAIYGGVTTLPITRTSKRHHKSIRFSSDVNLQRRSNFLKNLKRFSVNSFNRAKNKLNSLKSKVKNHKSKQDSDLSEDSAYDTSEVCHNPQGNRVIETRKKQKGQRSLSYQDLSPSNSPFKYSLKLQKDCERRKPTLRSSSPHNITYKDKRIKTHPKTRHGVKCEGSSDSGVEENSSDSSEGVIHYSTTLHPELKPEVALVNGVNEGKFRHWSYTSLQDELGYMP
ncbi:uncharacterized protein LOC111088381 [Limulus polyphemus]|uniref:Uncharacterized protein LOC111088381 n=1 Tax=Limulus polyphemus TaxID=6850 RepID=A0ABM1TDS8_LIMPO|nr:uncharacterized protein LOC111088381 [Limulus polyphemus]XP_022254032.1 uncharacterized protein LOC111088381 [Limulus polyphemus]XP_022254033.1 uncharacterized protein LOC111088381 [Limulus polyphemus]XP_022254034.1 uncharacterized protein LOC111088381 [Limulus polyphemus]XP_022254035.1 uncharacterized protein LOC111088381 [Limulus polyphemus]